jgi:hypothetical protein
LEIIHSDVCGPLSVAVGRWIFLLHKTFIDDLNGYKWYIYLMRKKYEIFEIGSKNFSVK